MGVLVTLLALPIVLLTMAVVFADAHRRTLSDRTKVAWTLAVGILSLVGFALVFSFNGTVYDLYGLLFNPQVVRTPYEVLLWLLTVGTAFSALLCLLFTVGTRVGRQQTA